MRNAVICLLLLAAPPANGQSHLRPHVAERIESDVLRLLDGDGLVIRRGDGREVEIRLKGIDAPELDQACEDAESIATLVAASQQTYLSALNSHLFLGCVAERAIDVQWVRVRAGSKPCENHGVVKSSGQGRRCHDASYTTPRDTIWTAAPGLRVRSVKRSVGDGERDHHTAVVLVAVRDAAGDLAVWRSRAFRNATITGADAGVHCIIRRRQARSAARAESQGRAR